MSKKNSKSAQQRRLQWLILQEKHNEQTRKEKNARKKGLQDLTKLMDSVNIAPATLESQGVQHSPGKMQSTIYKKVVSHEERGLLGVLRKGGLYWPSDIDKGFLPPT
ncbi:hypothetical protein cyc_08838 [Cyclospora cayetanensis]|uniref:Uncharacterized protein n=1 Tax=Cyclospora cayetanensis TaxID=88456 RepID=A0A1D3D5Z8_9EIME|nr:hypothetical protein cyc_08838 [Cyclospora cayetanensis]